MDAEDEDGAYDLVDSASDAANLPAGLVVVVVVVLGIMLRVRATSSSAAAAAVVVGSE